MPPDHSNSEILYIIGSSILIMLLLVAVVIAYVYRAQHKLFEQKLQVKEIEAKYKEELLYNNIELLEEERKRIAQDLHDEIGSIFSTLRLKINKMEQDYKEKLGSLIIDSCEIIDAGIQSVRRISHDMMPPGLEIFGLPDTLESFCDKFSRGIQMEVKLKCSEGYRRLPPSDELGLFRVVQELTNNTLRHAKATVIEIELTQTDTFTQLLYKENGKGFDHEYTIRQPKSGLGLRNIDARVSQIKGTINWNTAPGAGLTVVVVIPMKNIG